jgi:hypothetical protein
LYVVTHGHVTSAAPAGKASSTHTVSPLPKVAAGTIMPAHVVTLSVADCVLPYVALIETAVVDPTVEVEIVNVALLEPWGTVMVPGTVATEVFEVERVTVDPPAGAGAESVTVPVAD